MWWLRDLVPCAQFKKREKHPWRSVTFSSPSVFFTFFKLYEWYQIAQNITYVHQNLTTPRTQLTPSERNRYGNYILHIWVVQFSMLLSFLVSFYLILPEPLAWRCSVNKLPLKISLNAHVNTCVGVSFHKFQAVGLQFY